MQPQEPATRTNEQSKPPVGGLIKGPGREGQEQWQSAFRLQGWKKASWGSRIWSCALKNPDNLDQQKGGEEEFSNPKGSW